MSYDEYLRVNIKASLYVKQGLDCALHSHKT